MAILQEYHPSQESLAEAFNEAKEAGKKYLFKFNNVLGGQFCIESSYYTRAGNSKDEAFSHLCERTQNTTIRGETYAYVGYYDLSQNPPKFMGDELEEYQRQTLSDIYNRKFPPPPKPLKAKVWDFLNLKF